MAHFDLKKEENVYILTMINGENDNTFTLDFYHEYNELLDEIEGSTENAALVLTSSHPKTWSTGINLDWFLSIPQNEVEEFVKIFDSTLIRLAVLNLPTIACITGNCYAGAAIMSCCFDFRFMRADRGRFCFPEVNIKIPFTEIMHDIIDLLPNKQALNELALTGKAIGGIEGKERQVIDEIFTVEELHQKTLEFAKVLAEKDRFTYTRIKNGLKKRISDRKESK